MLWICSGCHGRFIDRSLVLEEFPAGRSCQRCIVQECLGNRYVAHVEVGFGRQRLTFPGLTVGAWNLGCIISAILTIFIGDLLGRRRTLILGLSLWIVGEIIQTSSYSFAQFVVGRAVAGFGILQASQYQLGS